jgi:hypothetical protein
MGEGIFFGLFNGFCPLRKKLGLCQLLAWFIHDGG